ncbi:MAG: zinc ABC transporter substrate-binding protein [Victivallales bacterium]|nr:zinc ABC transporter substrate-binding protein [Victivallales bacterium]
MRSVFSYTILTLFLAMILFTGCKDETKNAVTADRLLICSGLPPIAYLASAVGGDRVNSRTMLPEGRSPHDYSPGPEEIRSALAAKLFFTTGMTYENKISRMLNSDRTGVVDVGKGVERILFSGEEGHHDHDAGHKHDDHDHEAGSPDPHIWLSADNAVIIAKNIADALTQADPAGASVYTANFEAIKARLQESGNYAKTELAPYANRAFFVYHPAFGYFAKMTNLVQISIELEGRETTAARLAEIIKHAREEKVKVVFVQPRFNPTGAKALENAIGGKVAGLDALASDIPANFRAMTDALKAGFAEEKTRAEVK